jgi:hypothetical protein
MLSAALRPAACPACILRGMPLRGTAGDNQLPERNQVPRLNQAQNAEPTSRPVHRERAGLIFHARNRPADGESILPGDRSTSSPAGKAVEECRRGIPEVHRGYRSH